MDYETIDKEEMKVTVKNLLARTEKGSIAWECDEYFPAGFLMGDKYEEASKNHISHMGTFSCQLPGFRYELEIHEYVTADKAAFGSLGPKLSVYDENENLLHVAEVSIDEESPEDEYGFIPLCDAIFRRSDEWLSEDFFTYMDMRSFYPEKDITAKHREQPLCKLMERLMNERRVEDFHKMVLDKKFRERLLDTL